jgi:hypothetical protein
VIILKEHSIENIVQVGGGVLVKAIMPVEFHFNDTVVARSCSAEMQGDGLVGEGSEGSRAETSCRG